MGIGGAPASVPGVWPGVTSDMCHNSHVNILQQPLQGMSEPWKLPADALSTDALSTDAH